MPRRSSATLPFSEPTTRIQPPDDLAGAARSVFCDLVIATRADHFNASDAPTLAVFCRAIVQEKAASAGLAADGYVMADGKPSGWLNVLADAKRTISTYSRMLRLNPSARLLVPSPSSEPELISGYEKFALEAARDGRQ
ncbi:P27 family phage terminase small subunit [Bradyrhizobium cytisi]|uniref:P27 family phage terminase small subunit n=1 Tax=Bradyrhizobium cytisi TaxID=515489 RepID=A0A5S4WUL7_9BRAD|nr:P27 family phage terminase small subunit [Bradyrhizobium cytisi]TYL85715.1 P27 family phage terminase small subunit [Bradyrhizobium cytisi]